MNCLITVTLPINTQNYEGLGDSTEDAKLVVQEMLSGAADFPFNESTPITIGLSNEQLVTEMSRLLREWTSGPLHADLKDLHESTRLVLLNLEQNKQQTTEAKEI